MGGCAGSKSELDVASGQELTSSDPAASKPPVFETGLAKNRGKLRFLKSEGDGITFWPVIKGSTETLRSAPTGVAGAEPTLSKSGAHFDPVTLRSNEDLGEGTNVPAIVFVVPSVKDKFDSVSSGPSATPLIEPSASGSYCNRKPVLIREKSRFPLLCLIPTRAVEPTMGRGVLMPSGKSRSLTKAN